MARPAKQQEAARWLKIYLSQGSRSEAQVKDAARGLDISTATLNRVKATLGVESIRKGAAFHWRDPDVLEEQSGSPNLVAAIQELSRAVRQLAKADHPAVALEQPLAEVTPRTGWTDKDFEEASYEELLKYQIECMEDLQEAQKYHGTKTYGAQQGDPDIVIDHSVKIKFLQEEIRRINESAERKF
jgi:hypothetical protein